MRRPIRCVLLFVLAVLLSSSLGVAQEGGEHKTENILLVMTDGLRWQEVFRGAQSDLLEKSSNDANAVGEDFRSEVHQAGPPITDVLPGGK